jgi:hypothetical protein
MRKILLVLSAAFVGMTMTAQQDDQKKDSCQKKPAKIVKVKKKDMAKPPKMIIKAAPTGCFKRDSIETDTLQTDGQPLSKVRLEVDRGNE